MRGLLLSITAATLAAGALTPVASQESVRITGRVVEEETGIPIPGTDIIVRTQDGRFLRAVVADDEGRFKLQLSQVPAVRIHASRIGYRPNTTPLLWFDGHAFFDVEVRLDRDAVLLAPLEVLARSEGDNPVLSGFRHRLERGTGVYITREQIERRRPMYVTDLLADLPGVHLTSSGRGGRRMITMGRGTRQGCAVQVFVDGLLVTTADRFLPGQSGGVAIDDYVSPLSLEGIEVYHGLSTIPPEFLTPDAQCGVVALWTRRGG